MNQNKDWEVKTVNRFGNWAVDVYLVRKGVKIELAHFKNGQIELEEMREGVADPTPTMSIPMDLWEVIKKTMIDDKVREKSEVEAELGATKYHLEDMRKLVFKKKYETN